MRRNTVFSQLMQLICQYRFKKCVNRYDGDRYTKRFSCWQQLLVLLFAQAKGLTSLRDIEVSLRSHHRKWYHLGLTSVAKSTLADANNRRDADILKDVFYSLLEKCRDLAPRHPVSGSRKSCIRLIRHLSMCVSHSIRGRHTAKRKARSSSIPCSITAAIYRPSWFSPTGAPMTSLL